MFFLNSGAENRNDSQRVLFLMVSCIAFIALLPMQASVPYLMDFLEVLVIVSAVWVCATTRRALAIAAGLGLPTAVLAWITTPQALSPLNITSLLFGAALWIYVVALMLLRIVRTRKVTRETMYLAVSSYMLLGFVWTAAYILVELVTGGAFHMPVGSAEPVWVNLYYYSFVTLSTLGYGDITPIAGAARSLAILEAISGQMFLGLLIASLVGRLGNKSAG
ncbi:MAG: hypothetical protein KAJ78_08910 [Acidobacteria bacterium]|nr:hypothetical protein [Acidobacteriota bacterium]